MLTWLLNLGFAGSEAEEPNPWTDQSSVSTTWTAASQADSTWTDQGAVSTTWSDQ